MKDALRWATEHSRTKNQPKEEVFGLDIPRTSGGHSRGYPGPKLRSGRSKSWKKNKHLGADIHDPKARTSTTVRDFQKLRSEKLWAEFSFRKGVFLRKVHFFEILENLEILENPQTLENKGESDHFLEILVNLEILEIPPAKRPLS